MQDDEALRLVSPTAGGFTCSFAGLRYTLRALAGLRKPDRRGRHFVFAPRLLPLVFEKNRLPPIARRRRLGAALGQLSPVFRSLSPAVFGQMFFLLRSRFLKVNFFILFLFFALQTEIVIHEFPAHVTN